MTESPKPSQPASSPLPSAPATPELCDHCVRGDHSFHNVEISTRGTRLKACYFCQCESLESAAPAGWDVGRLLSAARELLDWMPNCSVGSSGYMRAEALEAEIAKFGKGGSLNEAVGVKADLEHPAKSDTGGEIADSAPRSPATIDRASWQAGVSAAIQKVANMVFDVHQSYLSDSIVRELQSLEPPFPAPVSTKEVMPNVPAAADESGQSKPSAVTGGRPSGQRDDAVSASRTLPSQLARHRAIEEAPEHQMHVIKGARIDTWKDVDSGMFVACKPEQLSSGPTREQALESLLSAIKMQAQFQRDDAVSSEVPTIEEYCATCYSNPCECPKGSGDQSESNPPRNNSSDPRDGVSSPEQVSSEVPQKGWIRVQERMPEYGDCVLAWCYRRGDDDRLGFIDIRGYSYHGGWADRDDQEKIIVTHWQALPSPPESEPQ